MPRLVPNIMPGTTRNDAAHAIINADHYDPFSYLGMHEEGRSGLWVRAFMPNAKSIEVIQAKTNKVVALMDCVDAQGLFSVQLKRRKKAFPYRLRVTTDDGTRDIWDPYGFGPQLGELDRHLIAEGTHEKTYDTLGAQIIKAEGIEGVLFSVWAPNARRVSVVGDFNDWDGRCHVMRVHPSCGIWEIFIPNIGAGAVYKFEIKARTGEILPLKADPYAKFMEQSPGTASIVYDLNKYDWADQKWMQTRGENNGCDKPLSTYEVHLGSWRRNLENGGRYLSYLELADQLIAYVKEMGFTHIELLPVSEYPFDGSWGYQPIGLFAPTSRFGPPDDFKIFVDRCHQNGIGVILDWVVGHFPEDSHGLGNFDGTCLYEHQDPRLGRHADWGTLIYNFGRHEVINYLIANALFWLEVYHIDGLRVDAVASMLYLDYSRQADEWVPNKHGGNENLEAIAFLKRLNEQVYAKHPSAFTIAEESTAWPMVSRPTFAGGLGFGYKWNMGWMHDTLRYISRDPIHREHHQDDVTFGLLYAFQENFVLPLSHDEVVHGKGSILNRMPGDPWQKFANLRLYYSFMYAHPGKKLLFMGCEFGQQSEWNHNQGLDWQDLDQPQNQGVRSLVSDLNRLYYGQPALHGGDHDSEGFMWIESNDHKQSVLSFLRRDPASGKILVVVCNFTPVVRTNYQLGVPDAPSYQEIFNSDSHYYGGSNTGNTHNLVPEGVNSHGYNRSVSLTLPPLATIILQPNTP